MLILSVKDYFRTSLVENGIKGGEGGRWIGERHVGTRNYRKIVFGFFFHQNCWRQLALSHAVSCHH